MPSYVDPQQRFEINREATMLDSGVLIAAFSVSARDSIVADNAKFFLDNPQELGASDQWLVPSAVLVEAWGFIRGRDRDQPGALNMLAWVVSEADVLRCSASPSEIESLANEYRVDVVDAYVFWLAGAVNEQCGLAPPLRVATLDTADFTRLWAAGNVGLRIFDIEHLELQDLY
jgi:hypothetical protein